MENSKNNLQEYFQKRALLLPRYHTNQCSTGRFVSSVELDINETWKKVTTDEQFSTKKEAEKRVASKAYDMLTSMDDTRRKAQPVRNNEIYLIDLDNSASDLELLETCNKSTGRSIPTEGEPET